MVDFRQNIFTEEHDFKEGFESLNGQFKGIIPTSSEISGIEIRLSDVVIHDNKTPKVWPFPGLAKVYFLDIVVSDVNADSISLDLKGFEKVNDGDSLNVDRTLYLWQEEENAKIAPTQVHIFSSLLKSKQDLRNVSEVLTQINSDDEYKNLVSNLGTVLKTTSQLSNISNIIFNVAEIAGKYLGKVEDKPLLTWFQSFTNINGDWDHDGKTEKQADNKYAGMKLICIVRDKDRVPQS